MANKQKQSKLEEVATSQEPSKSELQHISAMANEMRQLDSDATALELSAQKLRERFRQIQEVMLPDAMNAAGMKKFTLASGETLEVKPFVRASIPSQTAIDKADGLDRQALELRRSNAFSWLKSKGAEALIQVELYATFGKGKQKAATKFAESIRNKGYMSIVEETVHNGTLVKFLKEQLSEGVEVPVVPFSLFSGNKAEISKPKPTKK